ncbi:UvrD-helicase domain-containing protein [Isachenkonia alkalipeptolytica]|uniref:DNA 3'-5' helicase n=1 Tax=Isachenkonia alkalipeptolytica TaxID=2565777 RepID=A0AA43XJZ4_9CLOT|nr:UvrD-helicase domain-containing protein [Isachenkonia alkalipeptolytica]NBG88127.1 DNA helicase UvrD [Isachenkonia alkalipeptolytica]
MAQTTIAISSDFLTAFSKLPRKAQGKVTEFMNKFRNNPRSSGINFEKIHDAMDNKIHSVRIDDTYRGIVARQKETGVYLLLWVDHHDDAYDWARRKKCEINRHTGNVQVYDVEYSTVEEKKPAPETGLFIHVKENDLLELGVPSEQIEMVKRIETPEELYDLASKIPEDAFEGLEWIVNGFPVQEVIDLMSVERKEEKTQDFTEALQKPRSQKSFVIVEGEEELREIMAAPLEKWRVFLHPTQRAVVEREFNGPARVLGGAGTGKTVVAMHRAKWLASQMKEKQKILFTTFTANLADDIKNNLRSICKPSEQKRIEVVHLDGWVTRFLREQDYDYTIVYDDKLAEIWQEAIDTAVIDVDLSPEFFAEEWSKVVNAQEAYTKSQYLKASRVGRGTRLDRKKRMEVWKVFEEYQNLMKENRYRDIETAMHECRKILERTPERMKYQSIIVDEGQDFGMPAYRLLRALAGKEHQNDLFIVGDAHQRIYKNKPVLSRAGINIRGRSSYLKINYRTTEEIRKFAFGMLKGIEFDDLDEGNDDGRTYQSLTHGELPVVKNFKDAREEIDFLTSKLKELTESGVDLRNICIVARTHKLLKDYIGELNNAGFRTYEIKRSKIDDRALEGVRVATMHRVKGLEFQQVFVVAANNRIIPLTAAIDQEDPVAREDARTAEKCLLYVALTRAQEATYITSYGTASEFL